MPVIRVFVGCSPGDDAESQAVLEYTLRRNASAPVEITWMQADRDPSSPWGGWNMAGWSTPFTGFRWAIPEVCGFAGRAIYMDSDVMVLGDVAELWSAPIPAGAFALVRGHGRKQRTCVMLLDCAEARGRIPELDTLKPSKYQHGRMAAKLQANPTMYGQIEPGWNCVDLKSSQGIDDPSIRLIHYSSIAHQPHLRHAAARLNRKGRQHWYDGEVFPHWRPELAALFDRLLAEAIADGFTPKRYEPAKPFGHYGIRSYRGVRVKGFSA